jgi:hypothetical protein
VIAAGGKGGGRRILFLFLFLPSFCFGKDTPPAAKQHGTSRFLRVFCCFALGVWCWCLGFGVSVRGRPQDESRSMGCVRFDNA